MQEQLVSLQTARLAKDNGFNWECLFHYSKCNNNKTPEPNKTRATSLKPVLEHPRSDYYTCGDVKVSDLFWNHFNKTVWKDKKAVDSYAIDCPTQSLLQRWLREVHKIDIDINRGGIRDDWYVGFRKFGYNYNRLIAIYKTYELALEAGLLAALKLIK